MSAKIYEQIKKQKFHDVSRLDLDDIRINNSSRKMEDIANNPEESSLSCWIFKNENMRRTDFPMFSLHVKSFFFIVGIYKHLHKTKVPENKKR